MSIDTSVDELYAEARAALFRAKAMKACRFHPEVTIRLGDPEAERKAYAIATSALKMEGRMWLREDLMPAIKDQLDMATDGECPECARLRDT